MLDFSLLTAIIIFLIAFFLSLCSLWLDLSHPA